MARRSSPSNSGGRRKGRDARDEARAKKKGCAYCKNKIDEVDYKQFNALRTFTSEKGKIRGRRVTGLCRRHQNQVGTAIKRAREVALLQYAGQQ